MRILAVITQAAVIDQILTHLRTRTTAGALNLRRLVENTELRWIESKLARQFVDSGRAPTLVAGDFNTPVESRIFQRSWGDLSDAFSRAGFGLGMTKANGWISVRIDHNGCPRQK